VTTRSILVVEDDAIIALNSYELLTKSGFTVPKIFASGEELLLHLDRSGPPDLILMDIGLAGKLDGIETARRVKKQYDIPVIFLTAYSDDKRIAEAWEISPNGYIVKPFIERQFIDVILAALNRKGPYGPAE
jgi:two-component system, response regulator PdtaR